jgi:hypothetical protein
VYCQLNSYYTCHVTHVIVITVFSKPMLQRLQYEREFRLMMSLDCPILISSSVFVLYLVWVCPVFTADVSGLSSFDCFFCLRSVSCETSTVNTGHTHTRYRTKTEEAIKTGQSRDISSKHWTHSHKIQNVTADVSGLSSFDCLFSLRSVSCVSVSSVYCWCLWIVQFWFPLLSSFCILCECVQCIQRHQQ